MSEGEVFPVPEAWAERTHMDAAGYAAAVQRVEDDPEGYWRDVAKRLSSIERKTAPLDGVPNVEARYARWVRPELVGEVEAAEWTADPTVDPDARLRAPSWRGWREDKRPDEVVVEI